jgi:hypothetical protein
MRVWKPSQTRWNGPQGVRHQQQQREIGLRADSRRQLCLRLLLLLLLLLLVGLAVLLGLLVQLLLMRQPGYAQPLPASAISCRPVCCPPRPRGS